VVLGAHAAAIRPAIAPYGVRVVTNRTWQHGLAGTIRAGLAAVTPGICQDALFLLCDQPCLEASHLAELVAARRASARAIAASEYDGRRAVPAVFAREVWPELAALEGSHGAREVIARDPGRVVALPFAWGVLDVDTPADVAALASL
jgi:molybdenum cofactor cytidylyltransferase